MNSAPQQKTDLQLGKIDPAKWLRFVLLIIGIDYVCSLYSFAIQHHSISINKGSLDWTNWITVYALAYTPLIFLLLYQRNRWGWILFFVNSLLYVLCVPAILLTFFSLNYLQGGNDYSEFSVIHPLFILKFTIKITFVYYLLNGSVLAYFGVSDKTKKRTVVVTLLLTTIVIMLTYLAWTLLGNLHNLFGPN